MKKFYLLTFALTLLIPEILPAQNCATLNATFTAFESRCAATGAIKVKVSGGSGSYKYRVSGPVSLNFTSVDSITGLSAGLYNVEVVDINTGCQFVGSSIRVGGSYSDPRYILNSTDLSCEDGQNGKIEVAGLQYGRQPFTFSIEAPSAMGVGTSNSTGIFTDLKAGNYTIRLTDSCGGIQTRTTIINDYTWRIDGHTINRNSCNNASGLIKVSDSRGRYSYVGAGIPGMMYGILRGPGDTVWSSNPNMSFDPAGMTSTRAFAKDACGKVKYVTVDLSLNPSVGATVLVDQKTCSTFRATIQAVKDMYTPSFQLLDQNNNPVTSNSTGIFSNLSYGTYSIVVTDACTGVSITRTVTAAPPTVSVDGDIKIYEKSCNYFSARFTGQTNTTNPTYKIFDDGGALKGNNNSGIFQFLTYGKYRMEMKDGCVDTTIIRYINVKRAVPRIDSLVPAYIKCDVFGLAIKGDSIYSGANYCLYDHLGNQIACNPSGKFDSIPLGDYCVTIEDYCTGNTFTRCISVPKPTIGNDVSIVLNKFCSSVTITAKTTNFKNGVFSLLDKDGNVVATNNTGVFSTVAYGYYCIKAQALCPDTTVTVCINTEPVKPTGTGNLTMLNQRCNVFDLQLTGISNLSSPVYTFKNSVGTVIYKGPNSKVVDVPYGNYCVEIKNSCYDTTINVCGNFTAPTTSAWLSFSKSCNYGFTRLNFSANVYPVTVMVKNPSNVMVASNVFTYAGSIDNIPELPVGQVYTIEYQWNCGAKYTQTLAPVSSYLDHSATVQQLCPGTIWPDGYGNIHAEATTNAGALTVKIIKKDNNWVSFYPNTVSGSTYNFTNLGPATYIIQYNTNDGCGAYFYDTVTIQKYQYPDMNHTSAFQCDQNGFSVGAYVNNGVAPFTYEIMSSMPATPSIATLPQSSPVFNINNGTEYQLIRLRAVDACGNATLGDASILPLANNQIRGVTDNCIGTDVTLSIDTVINSVVTWSYKKTQGDATSVVLGQGFSHKIFPFTYSDIGYYYCQVVMNNGCVVREYEFNLDGVCHGVLPVLLVDLKGRMQEDKSYLEWSIDNGQDLESIVVERSFGNDFTQIGTVNIQNVESTGKYKFIDEFPGAENQYRLRLLFKSGKTVYSKVVNLNRVAKGTISVFPNPATDFVTVNFNNTSNNLWQVELINVAGQKTINKENVTGQRYTIQRTHAMPSGMYMLKVTNQKSGAVDSYKVLFK